MRVKIWIGLALALLGGLSAAAPPATQDVWKVTGKDAVNWTARLVFLEESNAGYFDWKSEGGAHSGREIFTYTFDEETRVLRISGEKIVDPKGNIVHAQYKATLSKDGKRLEKGTWFGPGVMPGTWSARRADEKG